MEWNIQQSSNKFYFTPIKRLNFLEPELQATSSRIDIIETMCQATMDRIDGLSKQQSYKESDGR